MFLRFFRWAFLLPILITSAVVAHPVRMANAVMTVEADGAYQLTLTHDVLAYVLDQTPDKVAAEAMDALLAKSDEALDAALSATRTRLAAAILITADEAAAPPLDVTYPAAADVRGFVNFHQDEPLPVMLDAAAKGALPPATRTVTLQFPLSLGPVVLTVNRPGGDSPVVLALDAEQSTGPIRLKLQGPTATTAAVDTAPDDTSGKVTTFAGFIKFGFEHILPEGLDHILFVLGLFLLSTKLSPLLWQVTAFTVAHSITLALSLYGVIQLPASVVEPLIALSIAFVAAENLFTTKLHPWRPAVVFAFGLVHGLGFAGILHELSLPRSEFLPALVGFNVGVELGQLAVLAFAFALVGWFRSKSWYRPAVTIPASILIAATGLFWTVQRIVAP